MSVLSDGTLRRRCVEEQIITPFRPELRRELDGIKVISSGLSSYGYDVTLAPSCEIASNVFGESIDPKRVASKNFVAAPLHTDDDLCRYVLLPPNSFLLGHTEEYFRIPKDLMVICLGKSTYARAGISINVTPIEPGFEGQVVIEVSNATSLPVRIYVCEGIAQFVFLNGDQPCEVSYADRLGKYQGQTGITHSKS